MEKKDFAKLCGSMERFHNEFKIHEREGRVAIGFQSGKPCIRLKRGIRTISYDYKLFSTIEEAVQAYIERVHPVTQVTASPKMKTNDFTLKEAKKAGIPEIQINDVSFMGEPCNGNLNIHGEYPDGTPYHNNITGEFANQGTTWEELTYEEIVSNEEDEVTGFAIIKCKDWL